MQGLTIFNRDQLRAELQQNRADRRTFDGEYEDASDDTFDLDLSTGESSRSRTLMQLYRDPRGDTRPCLPGSEDMISAIGDVLRLAPHFAQSIGLIERAAKLSCLTRSPMHIAPLLLLGAPGLGKSYVASRLAKALGTGIVRIAMNSISDTNLLLGHPSTWRGAKIGMLTRGLIDCETASPLFLLDEVDKLSAYPYENAYAPFLTILEPENSSIARDEYLCIDINLSHSIIIGTANEADPIPPAVRDRFMILEIPSPDEGQLLVVVRSMFATAASRYGGEIEEPGEDVLRRLGQDNPRFISRLIGVGLGFAAADNRRSLRAGDIDRASALLDRQRGRHRSVSSRGR